VTYATTVYRPADGGHVYTTDEDEPATTAPCAECDGHQWDAQHQLVEEYVPDLAPEAPRYAVEVTTTHGRDWTTNGLRWPNAEDARRWGSGLSMRWFATTDIVVVECDRDGNPTSTVVGRVMGDAPFAL
jgi:hypothetical protein